MPQVISAWLGIGNSTMKGHALKNGISLARPVAALGAAGVLAAAVVGLTGGSAAAATTAHQFTLCSTGNYSSGAVFDSRGGLETVLVPAGQCLTITDMTGISSDHVTVLGRYNNPPHATFTVGSFTFNDNTGGGADAAGTTTMHNLEIW
jgi:hypothetical protein